MSDGVWDTPLSLRATAGQAAAALADGIRICSEHVVRNAVTAHSFLRTRSRDRRFHLIPYDACRVINAIVAFATVIGLTVLVLDPHLTDWRASVPQFLMPMFRFFNEIGKGGWILYGSALFVVLSLVRDLREACPRICRHHWLRVATAFYVFASVGFAGMLAAFLKQAIGRARPSQFADVGVLAFDPFSGSASWASFPSGHTTTIMAFVMAVALLTPRLRVALLAAGFWIAFARLATGAHYPSDVIGGCALGALVSWLLARKLAQHRLVFRFGPDGALVPARLGRSFVPPLSARRSRSRNP